MRRAVKEERLENTHSVHCCEKGKNVKFKWRPVQRKWQKIYIFFHFIAWVIVDVEGQCPRASGTSQLWRPNMDSPACSLTRAERFTCLSDRVARSWWLEVRVQIQIQTQFQQYFFLMLAPVDAMARVSTPFMNALNVAFSREFPLMKYSAWLSAACWSSGKELLLPSSQVRRTLVLCFEALILIKKNLRFNSLWTLGPGQAPNVDWSCLLADQNSHRLQEELTRHVELFAHSHESQGDCCWPGDEPKSDSCCLTPVTSTQGFCF